MHVFHLYTFTFNPTSLKKIFGVSSVAQNIHILKLDNTHISHEPGAIDYLLHPAQQISDSLKTLLLYPAFNKALTKGVLPLVKRTFTQDAIQIGNNPIVPPPSWIPSLHRRS